MEPNEYQCAECGNIYEKGVSDEEVLKEKEDLWGDFPMEQCAIVCDDCFKSIMKKYANLN